MILLDSTGPAAGVVVWVAVWVGGVWNVVPEG